MPARIEKNGDLLNALQAENSRLKRAVEELSILNEMAREIGSSHDSKAIMDKVIGRSLRAVDAKQGVITLVDSASEDARTLVRAMVTSSLQKEYHAEQSLVGWMLQNREPLLLNKPAEDRRFRGVRWDDSIKSILCVPLIVRSTLIGVLTVYNKKEAGGFTEEDQRLLTIIAAQSAQVLENARLFEEEKELLLMQEDVRLASKIQMELLPRSAPKISGYDIAGKSIPAKKVGGDYFDFMPVGEDRLAICLGDVSGKGLPASLLMANLQATIRGQILLEFPCKDCIQRSNNLLFECTDQEKFATLFLAILNTSENTLCYTNAGHNHPLLFSKGKDPVRLRAGGIPLGIFKHFVYQEDKIPIQKGDLLVIYSDGITEATDKRGKELGLDELISTARYHKESSAANIIEAITAEVDDHSGDAPQVDDITLVVVKREA